MLSASQIADLKEELEGYLDGCDGGLEQALPESSGHGDEGDLAQTAAQSIVIASTNGNRRQLCRQVNDALQRIREMTYTDMCAVCGKPIPVERLMATPWAVAHVQQNGRCTNGSLHIE